MRPLVQLPMKTTSTPWPRSGLPGSRPMYASAFWSAAFWAGSATLAGSGTRSPTGMPMPGFVPQVIIGVEARRRRA